MGWKLHRKQPGPNLTLAPWLQVYNTHERERRQSNSDCQKKSLLHLAESLWALDLERTSYLILLLIVLFSTQVSHIKPASLSIMIIIFFLSSCLTWIHHQGCQIENLKEVDRCQNQYMMLLFRFCQIFTVLKNSPDCRLAGTCKPSMGRRRCMATSPRSWPSSSTFSRTATSSPVTTLLRTVNHVWGPLKLPEWKWYLRLSWLSYECKSMSWK